MTTPEVATEVQATAYLAAACRAVETDRPDPQLRDPFARQFLAARPAGQPTYPGVLDAGGAEVVTRTWLLDELLTGRLTGGDPPLLVNLGAGFCTRPYRLDLSACRQVLELDAAPVLETKDVVLGKERPWCPVRRLPVDLRDPAALVAALAGCGDGPVIVISEGVLPYLPLAAVQTLAANLAHALPTAQWLTDLVSTASAGAMAHLARTSGTPVQLHGLDTLAPFESAGWKAIDYRILPVDRRGPVGLGAQPGVRASDRVVDGVVAMRQVAQLR